jgi:outer membrane protein OmpA-like peptidoglycan-associated protein
MKMRWKMLFALLFVFAAAAVVFGEEEGEFREEEGKQAYKDTPYFSGMPNYHIIDAGDREFDEYRFYNGKNCTTVEGQRFRRTYSWKQTGKQASDLQITRNYANAVRGMGGAVLFDGQCSGADCAENCGYRMMTGRVTKGGNELWIEVVPYNDGGDYQMTIIVKEAPKQDVTAGDMLKALNTEGHIALYINFDTGMAIIKPEAQPIIDQIAALMKQNPDLKLGIEGHTDNVGDRKKNRFLSEERARSVVAALVNMGIDPQRLTVAGYGQDKPIADNKTEEGRAKNRRVELVKK